MKIRLEKRPVACITTDPGRVDGGGVPVFIAGDEEEMAEMALLLSRILDAVAHDMGNGVFLVVQH
ncbi:MAG: hypothetical protein R6U70_07495 [Bacillota bacterium]